MKRYDVLDRIEHDNKDYKPGETIDLNDEDAAILLDYGVISGAGIPVPDPDPTGTGLNLPTTGTGLIHKTSETENEWEFADELTGNGW